MGLRLHIASDPMLPSHLPVATDTDSGARYPACAHVISLCTRLHRYRLDCACGCCRMQRLANALEGGERNYMAVALQRDQIAYRSLLTLAGAVLPDPEPVLPRFVCGSIAMAFKLLARLLINPLATA